MKNLKILRAEYYTINQKCGIDQNSICGLDLIKLYASGNVKIKDVVRFH